MAIEKIVAKAPVDIFKQIAQLRALGVNKEESMETEVLVARLNMLLRSSCIIDNVDPAHCQPNSHFGFDAPLWFEGEYIERGSGNGGWLMYFVDQTRRKRIQSMVRLAVVTPLRDVSVVDIYSSILPIQLHNGKLDDKELHINRTLAVLSYLNTIGKGNKIAGTLPIPHVLTRYNGSRITVR